MAFATQDLPMYPGNQILVRQPDAWAVVALRCLSIAGLGIAVFLGWSGLRNGDILGCGSHGVWDCSHVLHSKWSKWYGIPVGILASGHYALMLAALWFARDNNDSRTRQFAWLVVSGLAVGSGLAAVWFISLQVFVLHHLCKYCMAVHTIGLVIYMLMNYQRLLDKRISNAVSAIAVAAASVLILGQVMASPPVTYEVDYHNEETETAEAAFEDFDLDFDSPTSGQEPHKASTSPKPQLEEAPLVDELSIDDSRSTNFVRDPITALLDSPLSATVAIACHLPTSSASDTIRQVSKEDASESKSTRKKKGRVISYPGVRANLNVGDWPMVGNANADQVVVFLFDYTCDHCSRMSRNLDIAKKRFGDQLAIVMLPVPLDAECNSTIVVTTPSHIESCELSRVALAVWRVDASAFPKFHRWMFSAGTTRTASAAYQKAATMVDPKQLAQEVNGAMVARFLGRHVQLYQRAGEGTLPKLLTTKITLRGEMPGAEELCGLLQRELALKPQREPIAQRR